MKIHGLRKHPLYRTVINQRLRCENPKTVKFKNHGGRGIEFKFKSIEEAIKYYETLGPKPGPDYTLDRLDNDGHYEFGNMGWADRSEQGINKRKKENTFSKFRGIFFMKNANRWIAEIKWHKKKSHIGCFKTELEAASAYLEKYFELHKKWPPEYSKTPLCYKTPLHHLGLIK